MIVKIIDLQVENNIETHIIFRFGKTALHFAVEHEHTRMVEFLLRQPDIQVDIKVGITCEIMIFDVRLSVSLHNSKTCI